MKNIIVLFLLICPAFCIAANASGNKAAATSKPYILSCRTSNKRVCEYAASPAFDADARRMLDFARMLNVNMTGVKINIIDETTKTREKTRLNGDARTENTVNITVLPSDKPTGVRGVMFHEMGHHVFHFHIQKLSPRIKQCLEYVANPPSGPSANQTLQEHFKLRHFMLQYDYLLQLYNELFADAFMVSVSGDPAAYEPRDFSKMNPDPASARHYDSHIGLNPVRGWLWQNRMKALVNPVQPQALAKLLYQILSVSAAEIDANVNWLATAEEDYIFTHHPQISQKLNRRMIACLSKK